MIELTPDEHKILVDAIQDSATVVHKGRKDMNERIGKLAEQAGLLGPSSRVGNSHEATEKFAELIVQECAEIADKAEPYKASDLIKQHFGVNNENV